MLLENSVTNIQCAPHIHMLFKTYIYCSKIKQQFIGMNMSYEKKYMSYKTFIFCLIFEKMCMSCKKIICRFSFFNIIIYRLILHDM